MTFFTALLQIILKAPQIIGIIKSIIDVIGSEQVQTILETIRESLKQEVQALDSPLKTKADRVRLAERVRKRFAEKELGVRR
jgi:hypothetical protein